MRRVHSIAVLLERRPGCIEPLHRPTQVARDERDLGFGNDTPGASYGLSGTERTRRTSKERFCENEITELRHRDASKRERSRVVA
jgi:hypothetical protein